MTRQTRKDLPLYKYMNAGSGVYKKNINSKDLGTSCWIWAAAIALVGIIALVAG